MDVTVAVFDVDNTLTVRDCVVPFILRTTGLPRLVIGIVARLPQVLRGVLKRDRDSLKSIFVEIAFSQRSVVEVEQDGILFADVIANSWMREDVVHRMRWHQDQDHVVIFVSASLGPYLHPLGDLCEVDAVLCTELEQIEGEYTGRILGNNCRGDEKVSRITHWCAEAGIPVDHVVFAYGDSSGDGPMLRMAQHGVLVKKMELRPVHS